MTDDTPDVITINEAARILGISGNSVRKLIARGRIPIDSMYRPPGATTDWTLLSREAVVEYAKTRRPIPKEDTP